MTQCCSEGSFLLCAVVLQLRECLESEVYELFHKKLTEQALIKDPKFLWCCHVSSRQLLGPPKATEPSDPTTTFNSDRFKVTTFSHNSCFTF